MIHWPTAYFMNKVSCGLILLKFCLPGILLALIAVSPLNAQIEYAVYVNPFVQRYGNLDNVSTDYTTSDLAVHYSKLPSQHVGVEMVFPSSKKLRVLVGLQHVSNHYKMNYRFYAPNTNKHIIAVQGSEALNTQSAGFRVGLQQQLNSRFTIQAMLGFTFTYKPKDEQLQSKSATTYGYYIDENGNQTGAYTFIYKYAISKGGLYPQLLIPELSVHVRLIHNLYLRVGTQLKVADFDRSSGYLDVLVSGKGGYSNGSGADDPLHFSRIKRTEFNYFLGLSYSFKRNKK